MRLNVTKLSALSAAVAAAGSLGLLAGTAGAATFPASHDTQCENGDSIFGRGASFARGAHIGWGAEILTPDAFSRLGQGFGYNAAGCNNSTSPLVSFAIGRESVSYYPSGSGSATALFGFARANSRVASSFEINFGGTDEPGTSTQNGFAVDGDPAVSYDNTDLETIPLAGSAIAIDVKLPAGCSVDPADRILSPTQVEGVFANDAGFTRWGNIFTITGTSGGNACSSLTINRVARYDRSGTTFALKQFLHAVDGAEGWATTYSTDNRDWPNRSTNWYTSNQINGAGALLDSLSGTTVARDNAGSTSTIAGGIGYADLATSRGRAYGWYDSAAPDANDERFWVYVRRPSDNVEVSPAALDDATTTTDYGAACDDVRYSNIPATTEGDWTGLTGTPTNQDYPICTPTYALAWEEPADFNRGYNRSIASATGPFTIDQARSTKDYITYALSAHGQGLLAARDYSALSPDLLRVAQAGAAVLGWNNAEAGE
ncbi:hypothetical protein VSS74_17130 [Conexibacter stalactiti]|uniref:PBP domain-containing protein n=1 Tax=Conexibacter stalactiti TaxID=1940611 RepID=A0ABU4HRY7_9ACTN|nr:hypothetical protein [Conexibacter stalactiti]MDW5596073.1 hypothetical protein [Conexibacter stalactiti]MEC5036715.1 hypothetical protein [Conexibacter stalactiti]